MKVTKDSAMHLATALLQQRGALSQHAAIQAEVLVEAELKGHPSHGLQRLPRILTRIERGLIDPATTGSTQWRTFAFLDVDGERGFGPAVAVAAIEELSQRASSSGIAVAAIRNSNHLGMLAYYVEQLAAKGQIGIAMSSSEALVHPYNGTRALLGTNPLAIGIPTAETPLVVDLATSKVSMGKIYHHAANGGSIPSCWARDAAGRPTTDATEAMTGSIAPLGDAKGYALGIALELLVASMAGTALAPEIGGTLDTEALCNKGDIFFAIDVGKSPDILARLARYLDLVRVSRPSDPDRPVAIPGDGARLRRNEALLNGFEIAPRLWEELHSLFLPTSPLVKGHGQ